MRKDPDEEITIPAANETMEQIAHQWWEDIIARGDRPTVDLRPEGKR